MSTIDDEAEPHIHENDLNSEQVAAANLVLRDSCSVLLTGAAGTGKSFLLRYIIQQLKETHRESQIAITGSTGITASHVSGCTLQILLGSD